MNGKSSCDLNKFLTDIAAKLIMVLKVELSEYVVADNPEETDSPKIALCHNRLSAIFALHRQDG